MAAAQRDVAFSGAASAHNVKAGAAMAEPRCIRQMLMALHFQISGRGLTSRRAARLTPIKHGAQAWRRVAVCDAVARPYGALLSQRPGGSPAPGRTGRGACVTPRCVRCPSARRGGRGSNPGIGLRRGVAAFRGRVHAVGKQRLGKRPRGPRSRQDKYQRHMKGRNAWAPGLPPVCPPRFQESACTCVRFHCVLPTLADCVILCLQVASPDSARPRHTVRNSSRLSKPDAVRI